MAEGKTEQEFNSYVEEYEQAKKERPLLGEFTDRMWFRNIPLEGTITDTQVSEQFREICAAQKLNFLKLCKKDVKLSKIQADVLKEVLSNTIVGSDKKSYSVGEDLVAERHNDLLLIAATYVNSL